MEAQPHIEQLDEQQLVRDTGDLRRWRTEIPNLYDDADLDPIEFRLLVHYKRIGNRCNESVRTTAKKCKISVGAVVEKRRSLADKGFVKLTTLDTGKVIVEVVDMWEVNFITYSTMSAKKMERAAQGKPREKFSQKPSQTVTQRPRSARDEVVDRLEKHFCTETGIPAPGRTTEAERKAGGKLWWNPLWRMYDKLAGRDVVLAEEIISATVLHMKAQNLSYIAPSSIENMAAYVVGNRNLNDGGGHGESTGSDAADELLAQRIAGRLARSAGEGGGTTARVSASVLEHVGA